MKIIHGIAYIIFSGNIKFGFKGTYAYIQETSSVILHETKFAVVLLALVTIISLSILFIISSLGTLIFLLHLLGSTGDIIRAIYLCKSSRNSYIKDREYRFDVIEK